MDVTDMEQVIETFGPLVLRIARSRMSTAVDAEEVFQEVFVTYTKRQPVFEDEMRARAWFAKTTIHHCRKLWRSIGRHGMDSLDVIPEALSEDDFYIEDPSYVDLRNALSSLPDKYRRPVELFYFADLSAEDTAKVLKISPNAVRTRLTRARQMLREMMASDT
ncbi:MAG: sigma-70 family RNA polymerase sigma factor [Firmicutes bacterium]|nr:sigma-70 family RNA polymerase sigma factor [Bacillota bacterium]